MSQEPGPRFRACRSRRATGRTRRSTAGRTGTSGRSCPPTGCPAATALPATCPGRPPPAGPDDGPPATGASDEPSSDLLAIAVTRADRSAGTVGEVLADTFTDAYLVLQDGELVTEWYGPLGAPDRPHALMSVSKSVVGCVAAVLIDRGQLDPDREITGYVPELAASGYAGALVRHVFDMRSGVRFVEEYANPDSDIRRLDEWVGWQPAPGRAPRALPVPGHAAGRGAARGEVPVPVRGVRRARLGVRARGRSAHGRAHIGADLGADGRRARRRPAARWPGHRGARRGPVRHRPRRGPVRPDAAGRRAGPGRHRGHPPGRAAAVAPPGPGRSTPTRGPRSPRRPPSGRFPAGGTGTSSGSARATTATSCSAWASTARCCTSAGAPTRSA